MFNYTENVQVQTIFYQWKRLTHQKKQVSVANHKIADNSQGAGSQ